jgi:predicted Co/Zn/Cd cation transporter (cation efflux family)
MWLLYMFPVLSTEIVFDGAYSVLDYCIVGLADISLWISADLLPAVVSHQ